MMLEDPLQFFFMTTTRRCIIITCAFASFNFISLVDFFKQSLSTIHCAEHKTHTHTQRTHSVVYIFARIRLFSCDNER